MSNTLFDAGPDEEADLSGDIYAEEQEAPEQPLYEEDKLGRRPDRSHLRVSGENLISTVLFAGGGVLVSKQIDPPVGRCVQLEAPLAAREIDKVIAGTFLDRILQPIFRKGDQLEGLGAIIALPVMVGLYERKPHLAPILEEQMKQTLENVMLDVVPLMTRQKAKFRRTARQMSDVHEAFNIPLTEEGPDGKKHKVDPANYIFANWVFQDAQNLPPEPENNGPTSRAGTSF